MNPDLIGKFCEQIDNLIAMVDVSILEETDMPQKLVYFDSRVTLLELRKTFGTALELYCDGQYDEKAFQETLKAIFAERWERIRHTSAAYTEPRYNATNDLCLDIAKILAPIPADIDEINNIDTPTGPYFVLMPSLVAFQDISMTNIHNYSLHQIMLSDDDAIFFPIHDCIQLGMNNARGLTHLCLSPENPTQCAPLTDREIMAISDHSLEAKQALNAVFAIQEARRTGGEQFASRLSALAIALAGGGAHSILPGHGQENDAGLNANTGIAKFFEFFEPLGEEGQEIYFARHDGLREFIDRLREPRAVNLDNVQYCVEIIADRIQAIISRDHIVDTNIELLSDACTQALAALDLVLASPENIHCQRRNSRSPRVLSLIHQLEKREQATFFQDISGCRNAWQYALLHEPGAIVDFPLTDDEKIIAQNITDSRGASPLFIAVKAGCHDAVAKLLTFYSKEGIDALISRETALLRAIRQKDTVLIKMLLEHGADPKSNIVLSQGNFAEDAFAVAVKSGDGAVLDSLIPYMRADDMPRLVKMARMAQYSFAMIPLCRSFTRFRGEEIAGLFRQTPLLLDDDIKKPDLMRVLFTAISSMSLQDKKLILSTDLLMRILTMGREELVPDFIATIEFLSDNEKASILFPASLSLNYSYEDTPFKMAFHTRQADGMVSLLRTLNGFSSELRDGIISMNNNVHRNLLVSILFSEDTRCARLVAPEMLSLLRSMLDIQAFSNLLCAIPYQSHPINLAAMPSLVDAMSECFSLGAYRDLYYGPDKLPSEVIPFFCQARVSNRPEHNDYKKALWFADFNFHLLRLDEQVQTLRANANALANNLDVLCRALREDLNQFKQHPTADAWLDFNLSVRAHIAKSGPVVTKERGVKNILANILLCLTGIGALFVLGQVLVDVAKGHQQVGFFKTSLCRKVDEVQDFVQAKPVFV